MEINKISKEIHELSQSKGWWESDNIPEKLLMIHAEVSEAVEAYRIDDEDNFNEELADIAIRVFDLASALEIDLEKEILDKHNFNKTRTHRHGGKKL